MELLYKAPSCCTTEHLSEARTMELGFTDTVRSLFERIAKAVFKGDLKAGDIDEDWFKHTSKELTDAVETGYDVPDEKMLAFLKDNVAIFSVAKTHKELRELTDLLTDGERVLPFSEFKDKAMGLFQISEDRLRSEYNHALGSAQMASKWSRIQEDKDALPMLVYRTVGDTHVRQEHAALDGIRRPVDDEFWDTHYPPNAWGCRCDVDAETGGRPTNLEGKALPTLPTLFRNNVGKTGIVFPDSHPYFEGLEKKKAARIYQDIIYALPREEQFDLFQKYDRGGEIWIHKLVDRRAEDFESVMQVAEYFAKTENDRMEFLPKIHEKDIEARAKVVPGAKGKTNADLTRNGIYLDVKRIIIEPYDFDTIYNAFNKAFKQADEAAVIVYKISENEDYQRIVESRLRTLGLRRASIFHKGNLIGHKRQ